jgi:hypothetical protein
MHCTSFAPAPFHQDHRADNDDYMPYHRAEVQQQLCESGSTIEKTSPMVALLSAEVAVVGISAVGY